MMDLKEKVRLHLFNKFRLRTKMTVSFVPRIGEEIRLAEGEYYRVTYVVWIYDEPDCPYSRANIQMEDISI
jgi:hypothetical protein